MTHEAGQVRLADVVENGLERRLPDLAVELTEDDYRRRIVAFAQRAREPFLGIQKQFDDDWDRELYERFWLEYEDRLRRAVNR